MKWCKWSSLLCLALACVGAAPLSADQPREAQPEPDWLSLVGLYPYPHTVTGQGEQAVLLWLQMSRTAQDVARASYEHTPSFGCYCQDIHLPSGPRLMERRISIQDFPLTIAVLDQAKADLLPIIQSLQTLYSRPRPNLVFPAVQPVISEGGTACYPSTNAALGVVFAEILGQYDKYDLPAFKITGGLIGTDRVLGGVHYPSCVTAGQRLGKAFATWWIDNHLALIQTACPEWGWRPS
jgi:acid phosphatase (class A)